MLNTKEKSLVCLIANIIGRKPTVLVNDFSNFDSISPVYVVHYSSYFIYIPLLLRSINQ